MSPWRVWRTRRSAGHRRFRAGVAVFLLVVLLVPVTACRSDGTGTEAVPASPDVRPTPEPPDEELAQRVKDTARLLLEGVDDLLATMESGGGSEEERAALADLCKEAAVEFRDVNAGGVTDLRDLCREINTNNESEDVAFWTDIRLRLDALATDDLAAG